MGQCLTPLTIKNPKPNVLGQGTHIQVPCGRCVDCINKRSAMWAFRLTQQEKISKTAAFITFTYDNENLPISPNGFPTLKTTDYQAYIKRQRTRISREFGAEFWKENAIKYYMVGEYGANTERPHYHAIMFNLPDFYVRNDHRIKEIWQKGNVQVDNVSPKSIRYVTGYLQKQLYWDNKGDRDDRQREFSRMSKAIGLNYLTEQRVKSMQERMNPYLVLEDGKKQALPRYYKNKVFTEEQREVLAAQAMEFANSKEIPTLAKIERVKYDSRQRKISVKTKRNKL